MRFFFDMNVTFLSSRFSFFVAHDVPRLHFIGDLPACFTLSSSSLLRTLLLSDTYDQWAIKYLIISYSARRRNYKKMRRGKRVKDRRVNGENGLIRMPPPHPRMLLLLLTLSQRHRRSWSASVQLFNAGRVARLRAYPGCAMMPHGQGCTILDRK